MNKNIFTQEDELELLELLDLQEEELEELMLKELEELELPPNVADHKSV